MTKNGPVALLFHALVVIFILAPLVIVCWVAFTPAPTLTLPFTEFSLRWFRAILDHSDFVQAFKTSLWLAFLSATLAVCLGAPAALAIARHSLRGRDFLNGLFLSPLMIPHLVLGISMLRFFALLNQTGSFYWLALGHVVVITPYVMRLVLGALVGFDRSIEHAAESLGAGRAEVFFRITLPLILPGLAGGWLLAFINSFDELNMSIFITSPATVTLPVRMYMYATESIDPMMAAVSAVVIGLTAVAMFILDRVYGLDKVLVGRH
jgi:putative spermidine/putrescine transport system permease protein